MLLRYHDAMAIVAKFGRPDLFITFTCNPNWAEIKNNLFPGQTVSDRPDLVARIFKLKLKALLADFLPVVVRGSKLDILAASIKSSPLWGHFAVMKLTINMRAANQQQFTDWLLSVGNGTNVVGNDSVPNNTIHIPSEFHRGENIVNIIYGSDPLSTSIEELTRKVIVTTKNKDALHLNEQIINLLPFPSVTYISCDSTHCFLRD